MRAEGIGQYHKTRNERFFDVSAFVAAYHYVTPPDCTLGSERFDFSQILLMLSGKAYLTAGGLTHTLLPGEMILRPAFTESSFFWDGEGAGFALIDFVCDSPAVERLGTAPIALQEEERATLLDLTKTAARICYAAEEESLMGMKVRPEVPSVVLSFVCSSLERFLSMLFCRLSGVALLTDETEKVSRHLSDNRLVEQVKQFLADNIEKPLTTADICTHLGISATALSRKLHKLEGKGVIELFHDMKIDRAKLCIRTSDTSFTDLAESLGFSSVGYFSKVFKKRVGLTPTEYSKYSSKRRAAAAKGEGE